MPSLHPLGMPKPVKAPKIASVHISQFPSGGFKVQHNMTHGPAQHPFVFQDPSKVISHLARIQKSEWREPDRAEGPAVTKDLNIGPAL